MTKHQPGPKLLADEQGPYIDLPWFKLRPFFIDRLSDDDRREWQALADRDPAAALRAQTILRFLSRAC